MQNEPPDRASFGCTGLSFIAIFLLFVWLTVEVDTIRKQKQEKEAASKTAETLIDQSYKRGYEQCLLDHGFATITTVVKVERSK